MAGQRGLKPRGSYFTIAIPIYRSLRTPEPRLLTPFRVFWDFSDTFLTLWGAKRLFGDFGACGCGRLLYMGLAIASRTATQRSKKGNEKVLGRVLGEGSDWVLEGF